MLRSTAPCEIPDCQGDSSGYPAASYCSLPCVLSPLDKLSTTGMLSPPAEGELRFNTAGRYCGHVQMLVCGLTGAWSPAERRAPSCSGSCSLLKCGFRCLHVSTVRCRAHFVLEHALPVKENVLNFIRTSRPAQNPHRGTCQCLYSYSECFRVVWLVQFVFSSGLKSQSHCASGKSQLRDPRDRVTRGWCGAARLRPAADGYGAAVRKRPVHSTVSSFVCFFSISGSNRRVRWGVSERDRAPEATVKPGSFLPPGPPTCYFTGRCCAARDALTCKLLQLFLI